MKQFRRFACAVLLAATAIAVSWAGSAHARWGAAPDCNTAPDPLALGPIELPLPYTYLVHVPDGLPNRPVPLLLAFHGLGGNGAQFARQTEWTRFADEHGFIVAFPTGPLRWNTTEGSRDVGFARRVVAEISAERCIDGRRVWATGHSYGGFMTQRLACDAGDLFAAGAVVSGGNITMPIIGGPCAAGTGPATPMGYEPVPLGFWHGSDDQVVPYDQGRKTLAEWAERYGCTLTRTWARAPYGALEFYGGCTRADVAAREAAAVAPFTLRFHTYDDHRHGYPDGCGGQGQLGVGECAPDPSAWPTLDTHQGEILRFLAAHPRTTPADLGG